MARRTDASRHRNVGAVLKFGPITLFAACTIVVPGCSPIDPFACVDDGPCQRSGVQGQCSNGYCSYPDGMCESGYRYSEYADDSVANTCVPVGDGETTSTQTTSETSTSTGSGTGSESSGDSSSSGDSPDPACGNGVLDTGEACDDGENNDGTSCNTECEIPGTVVTARVIGLAGQGQGVAHGITATADWIIVVGEVGELGAITENGEFAAGSTNVFVAICPKDSRPCEVPPRDGETAGGAAAFAVAAVPPTKTEANSFWVAGREVMPDPQDLRTWYGLYESSVLGMVQGGHNDRDNPDALYGVAIHRAMNEETELRYVTMVGSLNGRVYVERLDGAGEREWFHEPSEVGGTARAVAVGGGGRAAIVGEDEGAGWLLRTYPHGGLKPPTPLVTAETGPMGVAISPSGAITVVAHSEGDGWIGRYPAVGKTPDWVGGIGEPGSGYMAVAASGEDSIAVGFGESGARAERYDNQRQRMWTGAEVWREPPADQLNAVTLTDDGRLFAAGFRTVGGQLQPVVIELIP